MNPAVESIFNKNQTEIFEKIISFSWASMAYIIKKILTNLSLIYIRSEQIANDSQETRDEFAFNLYLLNSLIDDLRTLELTADTYSDKQAMFQDKVIGHNGWSDLAYGVQTTISNLLGLYVRSEEVTEDSIDVRETTSFNLGLLDSLVEDLRVFELASDE